MARRTLWNVPCTGHHRDGSPCRAWSIRGWYVCRSHGGATRQARRLAAYRLWRAGIWERAGRDAAMRLGALDERWRTDPLAAQAEVLTDLRAARTRLEQFRRINGRGPRTLAEHNLVLDGPPDA
jgi:hypothetical protein